MVVTMLPMAILPASAAYDYDETTKLSFKITNLVREWKGETKELGESGSGFYEQSLTKVADGKYKYTYKAALSAGGGTWWSDPKTVTFDGVDCESDYYKTFDFTESTPVGGYTMTWTYTLEVKRYKGHTYGAWSDNGDGTHTRTCVINSAHKETASHNYAAATCSAPETCKNCGATQGEPVADAHGWNAATCVLPQTCKYCGITQGEVLGHNMVAATFGTPAACSRCGATDINISVLEAALINTNVNLPSKAVKDDNAGYNDITWSVVDAGSTGATINGSTLKASYSGEAVIRATIESGSKDFTILFKSSEIIDISLGSVTVSKKDASTLTVAYAGFEGGSKDYMVGEPIQITGTTTSNYVEVSSGSATVILNGVSISRNEYCFRVNAGATADLTLVGSNAMSTGSTYAALSVPENATVTIGGEGTLTAIATGSSAAIGSGDMDSDTGTIVINGGTIIAENTYSRSSAGAGIGGGCNKNGGNITINGGIVTATGGRYAAGIGGGYDKNGGNITINGGIVTATGGRNAAGIGGGHDEGSDSNQGDGGQITITGGTVIANGGDYRNYFSGAGIGGGYNGNGGTVVITGGNIKATAGSSNAEAIGKGGKGESSGTIKDGSGNDLSLQTITLSGTAANTAVTATDGITYGLTDVKTLDTDKLYFYLPADTVAKSITAGGNEYICNRNLTYYTAHSWVNNDGICANGCGTECAHQNETGDTCSVCGAVLHTCDFSDEWKYDADKHWKECVADGCDEISEEAVHSYTNGKCDCGYTCPHEKYTDGVCDKCGYECLHEWGEGVLTRPTFETDGYYTYTCTLCGHSYTEPTDKADTTALNDASMKVTEYIDNDTLTQEAKDEIYKSYRDIVRDNGNIFDEFGFVRGDLVEEDQSAINAVTEELQKIIDEAEEKIASGEYVKADYTEIDEAIDDIEEKLASENVTDEGKAGLEEIKKQLEEMKADENTSAADVAELEKALGDYEAELDKGIEDGTLVEIDINKIADDVNKKWAEKLEAEGLLDEYKDFINNQKATDEAMATVYEINDFLNSLEGTVAENAENIAKLNEMLDSLYSSFENCLRGTHNFNDYEVTSPAKCEVNAKETRTCWFCGETDEREVEGSALEHIFLDYVSNGDATCEADGTKTAECIHGCGATDTVADEGSMLDHSDEDGDKICDDCGEEVYDRCDICGGKAHGDDKIQLLFCMIITIIRFVTSILKSIN